MNAKIELYERAMRGEVISDSELQALIRQCHYTGAALAYVIVGDGYTVTITRVIGHY